MGCHCLGYIRTIVPIPCSASGAASIANRAEAKKRNLYQELIHTHHFIPIGLETLGVFGDEALAFLKELGHLTEMKTSDSQSFTYMCQRIRLSVTIQRYNAEAILSCCNVVVFLSCCNLFRLHVKFSLHRFFHVFFCFLSLYMNIDSNE